MLKACLIALAVSVSSAQAETLIVGNKVNNTLSFIDLETGEEVYRRPTVRSPHEVALSPDGKTVVVASYVDGDYIGHIIDAYDVKTATKTETVTLEDKAAPHAMVWLPNSERILVATQHPANVVAVDIAAGVVDGSLNTGEQDSHLIALQRDGSRAFVTNRGSNSFTVIDAETLEAIATIESDDGTEAIDISPAGDFIWVGNRTADTLTIYDGRSFELVDRLDVGYDPVRLTFTPDGVAVAVADYSNAKVNIYDAKVHDLIETISLEDAGIEDPAHLMFSPSGDRLFVSGQKNGTVGEFSTDDWRLKRTLPAAIGADGLALSSAKLER